MSWFNYIGLIIIIGLMAPNFAYFIKKKNFENCPSVSKKLIMAENVGRYGSMTFMVFNIPYAFMPFFFQNGRIVYIIVNTVLLFAYILSFVLLWKKDGIVKSLLLSIIPSTIFLFSAIMIVSAPLLVFSTIFSFAHITLSVKNALFSIRRNDEINKKSV